MKGHHKLAKQTGGRGCFAEVELEVEFLGEQPGLRVEFEGSEGFWASGIRFGIAYAFERTVDALPAGSGAKVRVTGFRGTFVDTSEIAAAFAAAQAYYAAINVKAPAELRLDGTSGDFVFPR